MISARKLRQKSKKTERSSRTWIKSSALFSVMIFTRRILTALQQLSSMTLTGLDSLMLMRREIRKIPLEDFELSPLVSSFISRILRSLTISMKMRSTCFQGKEVISRGGFSSLITTFRAKAQILTSFSSTKSGTRISRRRMPGLKRQRSSTGR